MYAWRVNETVAKILRSAGVKKFSKIARMSLSGRDMYLSCNGEDGTVPMKTVCNVHGHMCMCMCISHAFFATHAQQAEMKRSETIITKESDVHEPIAICHATGATVERLHNVVYCSTIALHLATMLRDLRW